MQLIIGTYTERLPHVDGKAEGIMAAEFETSSGRIGPACLLAPARNPSYLVLPAAGDRLYAVCETDTFEGRPGGGLLAFARDPRSGELAPLSARRTLGESPCHVALVRGGRFAVTANYGGSAGSVTVFPAGGSPGADSPGAGSPGAGGGTGEPADHVVHAGSGPNAERQASSHAHMIASDPETGDILVADLGADAIFAYSAGEGGRLALKRELKAAQGTGPRHLVFHPGGRHLFVAGELDGTVSVWRRGTGGFAVTETVRALPAEMPPAEMLPAGVLPGGNVSLPAAIRVSPSGRHVLVANRGHGSISVFAFDPVSPGLRLAGVTRIPGACPRDFILTPDGRRLIVASQDSDLLASYEFDDADGALRPLHQAAAPTPVCLVLA